MCSTRYRSTLCFILIIVLTLFTTANAVKASSAPQYINKHVLDYDIIIDIGHGGIDGGTTHGNVHEKHLNLAIGAKLYHLLRDKGYQVGVTRLHDYALSDDSSNTKSRSRHMKDLHQRQMIAESLQPKAFISIHTNFSTNPSAKGPIILHQKQGESYLLAELLQEELNQHTQSNKRPKESNRFYLLQRISQPCLIAEVGFISHSSEREKLQDPVYQEQIATRMAAAIDRFFILYP